VTLAKGDRAAAVADACRRHGGVYLGTIGGAAALLAREHVVSSEAIDYADLGMEAVRRIEVRDLPALVVIDSGGPTSIGGKADGLFNPEPTATGGPDDRHRRRRWLRVKRTVSGTS